MKRFEDVKVGDHIICYDEYSHDYEEHEIVVESLEYVSELDDEGNPEGIVAYGTDLTYPEDETDDYITRVNKANFVRFV